MGEPRALYRKAGPAAEAQAELEALAESIGEPSVERVVLLMRAAIVARSKSREVFVERAVTDLLRLARDPSSTSSAGEADPEGARGSHLQTLVRVLHVVPTAPTAEPSVERIVEMLLAAMGSVRTSVVREAFLTVAVSDILALSRSDRDGS